MALKWHITATHILAQTHSYNKTSYRTREPANQVTVGIDVLLPKKGKENPYLGTVSGL